MATLAGTGVSRGRATDVLSGTPRAHSIDRWIFVAMAVWFIAIVLVGFIPDSVMKVEMVRAGQRMPFPMALHAHAVVMGAFLLLLLAQAWLMATGRRAYHMQLGIAGYALAALLVVVGFILVPTMYHQVSNAIQGAPPEVREALRTTNHRMDNIMLLQIRVGLLFTVCMIVAARARRSHSGLHKRMMFLATSVALGAAFARMRWLPTSMPGSPMSMDLCMLAAVAPMFAWDVLRNRRVHEAYWIWLALLLPLTAAVYALWDTPAWHATARQIMGVA